MRIFQRVWKATGFRLLWALRFKLVDKATFGSSNAVDEIGIFLSDEADLDFVGALRFFDDVGEIICL